MRYYLRSMFASRIEVLFATANLHCHFHTLDTMNISVFCLPPAAILTDILTFDELIVVITIWCQNWVGGEYGDLLASRWRVSHPESCPRVLRPNHNCGLTRQYAGRQIVHTRANWCHAKEQIGNWPGQYLLQKSYGVQKHEEHKGTHRVHGKTLCTINVFIGKSRIVVFMGEQLDLKSTFFKWPSFCMFLF